MATSLDTQQNTASGTTSPGTNSPGTNSLEAELTRRTILRSQWVPCKAAFIDCRTPGSDKKDNYSFIGLGVSQNSDQFINLQENHGFNLGAAGMPNGVVNSLHLHFTAEVFINFGGTFQVRWGSEGTDGEYASGDGDVISVPSWIFRGFTNTGADEGILLTVLGQNDTGGILWGPSVLKDAEEHGLHLTSDNQLIDTVAGDTVPGEATLIRPMQQQFIDQLTTYRPEEMRARVTQPGDRDYNELALLCNSLDGGKSRLALVIGYGMSENRRQVPRLHEPHSFNLAWLNASAGQGMLRHRHHQTQVLTAKTGRWQVTVSDGEQESVTELGHLDSLSVPAGLWRTITCLDTRGTSGAGGADEGELLVVNSGDGRTRLEWDAEVVRRAHDAGLVIDPNGYLAPTAVMEQATEDD